MRTLRVLSDLDKHRAIVPTHFYPLAFHAEVTVEGANRLLHYPRLSPGKPATLGSMLSTWTLSAKPKKATLHYSISGTPAFAPSLVRPSPGNTIEDVTGTLTTIHDFCVEILENFDH